MTIKVHFLNVGHGDCTIIEHESGRLTMIDINNSTTLPLADVEALAETKNLTLSAFRHGTVLTKSWDEYYRGLLVDPVEFWRDRFPGRALFRYIQSHPDMDHMSGLGNLLWTEKVPVENFWDIDHQKTHTEADFDNSPYSWYDWAVYRAAARGGGPDGSSHAVHRKTRGATGDFWTPDGLTVLSPTTELADYCDRTENWNNGSYVLALEHGGRRLILPGDAEKPAWDALEAAGVDLSCDVLKAAHHGRKSGIRRAPSRRWGRPP